MPKSSIAMMQQASGVFAAPAKTATNPIPASKPTGSGSQNESALPSVAPIKKSGVTSPPLKPAPRVIAVKRIFKAKSSGFELCTKASTIVGIPKPIYL